jgi:hypothetical protein
MTPTEIVNTIWRKRAAACKINQPLPLMIIIIGRDYLYMLQADNSEYTRVAVDYRGYDPCTIFGIRYCVDNINPDILELAVIQS